MAAMDQAVVFALVESFRYFGVFIVLGLIGFIIPIPEEVLLLIIGYSSALGFFNLPGAIITAILSVIFYDNVIYWLSRKGSHLLYRFYPSAKRAYVHKYGKLLKNHAGKWIFLGRFFIWLRFMGPAVAGSLHIPWRKYLAYEVAAAMIFVPAFILLGYHFNVQMDMVIAKLGAVKHILFIGIVAILGFFLTRIFKKKQGRSSL
ncbi:DedA family protein [Candidatus Woesearchaeota archaeon]|nr:DedA family protein [Candidatus Woesearchaeota archaeon]